MHASISTGITSRWRCRLSTETRFVSSRRDAHMCGPLRCHGYATVTLLPGIALVQQGHSTIWAYVITARIALCFFECIPRPQGRGWTVENLLSGTVCSSASERLVPNPTLVPSEDWNCKCLEQSSRVNLLFSSAPAGQSRSQIFLLGSV